MSMFQPIADFLNATGADVNDEIISISEAESQIYTHLAEAYWKLSEDDKNKLALLILQNGAYQVPKPAALVEAIVDNKPA